MNETLARLLRDVGIRRRAQRWLIVAAHPDDEVIGATYILRRARDLRVLHVTDGAPRNPALRSPRAPPSRRAYADLRAGEARAALIRAGLSASRAHSLGFVDQEAAFALPAVVAKVRAAIETLAPDVVVVQPYEGGHPDHDAAAFAVHEAARQLGARAPALLEMTSYHRRDGTLRTGDFLPAPFPIAERNTDAAEKREMMACFASQAEVLAPFGLDRERFRKAPRYDFCLPPHAPPLHYETLGWTMTASRFCALAATARRDRAACGGAAPC